MTTRVQYPYEGQGVALLTRHGKEALLREPLETALGCHLVHTDAHDTDELGTFTGEVARPGSQREAARAKARIGMTLTGARVGLASEGAFGPDPFAGVVPWNTELLLWIDDERGIEVAGLADGPAQNAHGVVTTAEQLHEFAHEARFPQHHLVLRPDHERHPEIHKGINDPRELASLFEAVRNRAATGGVFVQNDLRAFCNPTRQAIIRKAALDLAQKLLSPCPACATPGYARVRHIPGLPCRVCGARTRLPVAEVWACLSCTHEERRDVRAGQQADPGRCGFCNP